MNLPLAHKLPRTLMQCMKQLPPLGHDPRDLQPHDQSLSLMTLLVQATLTTSMIVHIIQVAQVDEAACTVPPAVVIKAADTVVTTLLKTTKTSRLICPEMIKNFLASMTSLILLMLSILRTLILMMILETLPNVLAHNHQGEMQVCLPLLHVRQDLMQDWLLTIILMSTIAIP